MSTGPLAPIGELYCAEQTRQADEPIYGTATEAQLWLLLEYRQPWGAKVTADNELPAQVQDFLARQAAAVPRSRLLFIKQQNMSQDKLRFFVVKTAEARPASYEFQLDAYEDLLALDIAAIAEERETYDPFRRAEPLYLVCANSRRDKCCAKFGRPVYEALRESEGEAVWHSSHIGGHRYAPTLLFLPHSVNLGLLGPEEAQAAGAAYRNGRLHDLARYRGRTYYAPIVQAADYFLRQERQYYALSGMNLRSVTAVAEEIWLVRFDIAAAAETHELKVQRQMTAEKQLVSCSSPAEKAVPRYRLLAHSAARL